MEDSAGEVQALKVALLYTAHRQFDEVRFTGAFLRRCSALLRNADVLLHCNNKDMDPALLERGRCGACSALASLPNRNKRVVHTAENAGYKWGPLQQVSACLPMLAEYDFVIHLHPDVYITDDSKLIQLIRAHRSDTTTAMLVNCLHAAHVLDGEKGRCLAATPDDVAAYSFDFFVMRPKYLRHNVFDAYQDHERIARLVAEGRDFPEMLLHDAIKQSGTEHVVFERHVNQSGARQDARFVDAFGMWHSHNNFQVERFLRREGYELPPELLSNGQWQSQEAPVSPSPSTTRWYHCSRCGDGGAGGECARCREYGFLETAVAGTAALPHTNHSLSSTPASPSSPRGHMRGLLERCLGSSVERSTLLGVVCGVGFGVLVLGRSARMRFK